MNEETLMGWRDRDAGRREPRHKLGTSECHHWLRGWAWRDKILKRAAGWKPGQVVPPGMGRRRP